MANKLAKAPLVEVIFEIKFKDHSLVNYDLFAGDLYSSLKPDYPHIEHLKPVEMPSLILPFVVQHRFRKIEKGFPLYQIGPGIVTYNVDGATYNEPKEKCWEKFRTGSLAFITAYIDKVGEKYSEDAIEHFQLRFINKLADPKMYPDVQKYFSETLQLDVNLNFARDLSYTTNLEHSHLEQVYKLDTAGETKLISTVSTITEEERKLLIDLTVQSKRIPATTGIEGWLDKSHDSIEEYFLAITKNITELFK